MKKQLLNLLLLLCSFVVVADNKTSSLVVDVPEESSHESTPVEINKYFKEAAVIIHNEKNPISLFSETFLDKSSDLKQVLAPMIVKRFTTILNMYGCTNFNFSQVNSENAPDLYSFIEQMCKKLSIEVPRIYLTHDYNFYNCCAGGDTIILGPTYLHQISLNGIEFTIAHELGHLKQNVDLKLLGSSLALSIPYLGFLGYCLKTDGFLKTINPVGAFKKKLLMVAYVIGSRVVGYAQSRSLEYDADKKALMAMGLDKSKSDAFIEGLRKIESASVAPSASASLFKRVLQYVRSLACFKTHPSLNDRAAYLNGLIEKTKEQHECL